MHFKDKKGEIKYLHHHIETPVAEGSQEHVFQSVIDQFNLIVEELFGTIYAAEEAYQFGERTLDEMRDVKSFFWSLRGNAASMEESINHLNKKYGRENILNFAKFKRVTLMGGNDE